MAMSYHVDTENQTQEVFLSLHYCLEVFVMAEQSNSPYIFRPLPVVPKYFELVFLSLVSSREFFPF